MTQRNPNLAKLHATYLFAEIARRKQQFLQENPDARLISLGIGDTTSPIPQHIVEGFHHAATCLGDEATYTGYEEAFGRFELRKRIANKLYHSMVEAEEVYISDGSKCDIARLQLLFGTDASVAVQDPSYPAYVGSSVIAGKTGSFNPDTEQYEKIVYMACTKENGFFPDLSTTPRADIIYFCSPNNPTGETPTRQQLEELVAFTKKNRSILIFDTAYSTFIQDSDSVHSIYEIEGAREVAIETSSFSKMIGFTGVRLGWTVVPKELRYDDGTAVADDWKRILSTCFNGASNIAQIGGIAALDPEGIEASRHLINAYMENAKVLREAVELKGYTCYGGVHAPYIWVDLNGKKSWDAFDEFLYDAHIVSTPGAGFGPSGEGFLRLSAFGKKEDIQEAAKRIKTVLQEKVSS
ncbi:MAG: LL-diaminopimelate aminotransferase [Waddliaceae bacterium]|nr:LL-diaminopimelate aminotransferase [Waddliaceae bacterium]